MKGSRFAALSLTVGFCALIPPVCYSQADEVPGTTVAYQITPNTYVCGGAGTTTINCYAIPFNLNGTPAGSMWLYGSNTYSGGVPVEYGWGFFNGGPNPSGGPEFTLSNWAFNPTAITVHNGYPYGYTSFPCAGNCSTFTGTITGVSAEGQSYTAQVSVEFWYYRACGRTCTTGGIAIGGTVTMKYQ